MNTPIVSNDTVRAARRDASHNVAGHPLLGLIIIETQE